MSINNKILLTYLNKLLKPEALQDFCPNGLQVEGKTTIANIVCGVTASQALIEQAVEQKADAIFVHHGYFWKGEDPCVQGMKRRRLAMLLAHDINLYAYHLPLDVHPQLGNNMQLAKELDIEVLGTIAIPSAPEGIVMHGRFKKGIEPHELSKRLEKSLARVPLLEQVNNKLIHTVAWCTGGGQGYITAAAEQGIDAFITGEVSEQTIHSAREMNIHFYAAGHHATERYGAKAVGEHLAETFDVDVKFIDIANPA
jgi:dinuclear metal center YbgI/SA1388 family protein